MPVWGEKKYTSIEGVGRREAVWRPSQHQCASEKVHTWQPEHLCPSSTLTFPLCAAVSKSHASLDLNFLICKLRKMMRPASQGCYEDEVRSSWGCSPNGTSGAANRRANPYCRTACALHKVPGQGSEEASARAGMYQ